MIERGYSVRMTSRLIHSIVFTLFMFLWLSRVSTGVANLSYGYALMSMDLNQLVDEGALQVVDESLVKRVMGVEQLDADRFGDELVSRYSGMNGSWFITAAGGWLGFWVLVYFTLYQWMNLYRDRKKLRSSK